MRRKIVSCRYRGKASWYFETVMCASSPGDARLVRDRLRRQRRSLNAPSAVAGILLADMPNHPDLRRDDVQLFGDDRINFCEYFAIVRAAATRLGNVMYDIDSR